MEVADAQSFVAGVIGLEVHSLVTGGPGGVIGLHLARAGASAEEARWYLGVDSAWRLENGPVMVTAWTSNEDRGQSGGVRSLKGEIVSGIEIIAPAFDLDVRFERGKRLVVFADTRDETRNCWFLLDPNERAVNMGPAGCIDFET